MSPQTLTPLSAAERGDSAARAGADAAAILTAAEKAILAAMTSAATSAIRGTVPPALARRKVRIAAAAALGAASSRLLAVYDRAVKNATGETGPLPDAPGQVAAAILRAREDAGVAFGAVLAAAGVEGSRMPSPSSPYRRIVNKAVSGTGPGPKAAQTALTAITARGLTGYTSPRGRRWPLGAYAERAVRTATVKLAKAPFTSAITVRREALLAAHLKVINAAWNEAVKGLDVGGAAAAFRTDSRTSSMAPDAATAKRWRQEAASSAVQGILAGIYQAGGYAGLVAAIEDTVRDGMAEGEADAMAAAAYQQHLGTFDTSAAFAAVLATLQGDYGVTRQAQETTAGLIAAAAADAARALAGQPDGSSEEEDAEAVRGAVSGSDVKAAGRWAEAALWGAFGAGAIALWRRAASALGGMFDSTEMINWVTDSSPCALCQQNAAGSPYAPADVPPYLAHGHCRCDLESDSRLPLSWLASSLASFLS